MFRRRLDRTGCSRSIGGRKATLDCRSPIVPGICPGSGFLEALFCDAKASARTGGERRKRQCGTSASKIREWKRRAKHFGLARHREMGGEVWQNRDRPARESGAGFSRAPRSVYRYYLLIPPNGSSHARYPVIAPHPGRRRAWHGRSDFGSLSRRGRRVGVLD